LFEIVAVKGVLVYTVVGLILQLSAKALFLGKINNKDKKIITSEIFFIIN